MADLGRDNLRVASLSDAPHGLRRAGFGPTARRMSPETRILMRQARPYPLWLRYLVPVLSVGLCTALRVALDPFLGDRTVFLIFVPALIASAATGGFGPSLAAALLAVGVQLASWTT